MTESPGFSTFVRDDDAVYHAYTTTWRGLEFVMSYYPVLDRAPKGRDEGADGSSGSAGTTSTRTSRRAIRWRPDPARAAATSARAGLFASPAGSGPRRLVGLLRIDGRPRSVHETGGSILLVKIEQRLQRLGLSVHRLPRVPEPQAGRGRSRSSARPGEGCRSRPRSEEPRPEHQDGREPTTRRRQSCAARSGCSRRRRGGLVPPSTRPQ